MKIPKTMMQTYCNEQMINQEMLNAINTWKDKNPDWKHEIFYDKDCIEFIKKHFKEDVLNAFKVIKSGAGKADLFRYCYLYIKGGVYIDIDNICVVPLKDIIKKEDDFIGVLDLPYNGINTKFNGKSFAVHQSFVACKPLHSWLDMAIKLSTYNILNKVIPTTESTEYLPQQTHQMIKICGPKLFADAINISSNNPINSTFVNNSKFPFKLVRGDGSVIKNLKGNNINGQWISTIQDKTGKVIIKCKYDGYNPGVYWAISKLYN